MSYAIAAAHLTIGILILVTVVTGSRTILLHPLAPPVVTTEGQPMGTSNIPVRFGRATEHPTSPVFHKEYNLFSQISKVLNNSLYHGSDKLSI